MRKVLLALLVLCVTAELAPACGPAAQLGRAILRQGGGFEEVIRLPDGRLVRVIAQGSYGGGLYNSPFQGGFPVQAPPAAFGYGCNGGGFRQFGAPVQPYSNGYGAVGYGGFPYGPPRVIEERSFGAAPFGYGAPQFQCPPGFQCVPIR